MELMASNQVPDPVALPRVPSPDCGRIVVTFVARRGQFAGEHFYKWRNHNVKLILSQRVFALFFFVDSIS